MFVGLFVLFSGRRSLHCLGDSPLKDDKSSALTRYLPPFAVIKTKRVGFFSFFLACLIGFLLSIYLLRKGDWTRGFKLEQQTLCWFSHFPGLIFCPKRLGSSALFRYMRWVICMLISNASCTSESLTLSGEIIVPLFSLFQVIHIH